ADRYDEPPSISPWSAGTGQRRFGDHVPNVRHSLQVDSVLSANGRGPARPLTTYHRAGVPLKFGGQVCKTADRGARRSTSSSSADCYNCVAFTLQSQTLAPSRS